MKLSLRVVVIGGVVAGLLIPMSVGALVTGTRQKERLLADAKATHQRATDVLALGVQKALWDLAPEGAVPLVKSVMDDPRIVQATVLDGQGAVFHEEKDDARRSGTTQILERSVLNEDKEIGRVRIEFSLASAEAQIHERLIETLVTSGIQALVCILILVGLLNRRVIGRIELLKGQARRLAEKSLEQPFTWQASDELGELGVCLESTRLSLRDLFRELEQKNADLASINANLEGLVEERTATIKMILDHVRSGFLLIDRKLKVADGYTKSCESLTGRSGLAGSRLADVLGLKNGAAAHFEACVDQVFDDIFPEDVSLEQIPPRVRIGERTLSIEGSTVRQPDGKVASILFTVIDVTVLEQTEKENRANRSMVRILQNITSFRGFVAESRVRLGAAKRAYGKADDAGVRRELHTLKGNSSAFGLEDLATLVHSIEDEVRIADGHLAKVERAFASFLEERYELLRIRFGEEEQPVFNVTDGQLRALSEAARVATSVQEIEARLDRWSKEIRKVPVESLLGPIASYIEALGSQRGKLVRLVVDGGKTRVDGSLVKPLVQNLVHLLRNSIDHGIETPDERGAKGPVAKLEVRFSDEDGRFRIVVKDDGRGIDVRRVLAKAVERGLVKPEQAVRLSIDAAVALIFSDGLSTAESVSDTSGRGVGMTAVKSAVEQLGGTIEISTQSGKGTEFRLEVPTGDVVRATRAA